MLTDSDHEAATWNDIVEEEYTHDFSDAEDHDVFDPNTKTYRVRAHYTSLNSECVCEFFPPGVKSAKYTLRTY